MTRNSHRAIHACAWTIIAVVFGPGQLRGQDPPDLPPEDQQVVTEFREAIRRFRAMPVDTFLAEYGPTKRYLLAGDGGFSRGDVTSDGQLNITDVICALGELFLGAAPCGSEKCLDSRDANDDGNLDVSDPVFVLLYLFTGGAAPPPPFPGTGGDPTPDSLDCPGGDRLGYDPLAAQYLDLISSQYPLSPRQRAAYERHGFVIAGDRKFTTFFQGFKEAFVRHLPVYVSADSLLDALHLSFDRILMDLEENLLAAKLGQLLEKAQSAIRTGALERHAGGADISAEADDAAFWICTASSLLTGGKVPCARPVDGRVQEFLQHVASETFQTVDLFGATLDEDFSQFRPRGHYTRSETLRRYFQAMMWVQRIGMRFTESKRHALVAFLLTRLLEDSTALAEWDLINGAVDVLVGSSDSLNPRGLSDLLAQAGMETAADFRDDEAYARFTDVAFRTGAGLQHINSMLLASNPTYEDGFTPIPPVFNVMGQRFIVDSFVFTNVVYDRVQSPDRFMPSPLDAWFVLGNRATLPLLEPEVRHYEYQSNLAALDWIVASYTESFWSGNLYNLWLSALKTLHGDTTPAAYPAVMRTLEWDRRMLNAQLASWAHLRHDTLLYAKPSYSGVTCDYPDGWVDPYPEFYGKLVQYAERAVPLLDGAGVLDTPVGAKVVSYLERLSEHSRALEGIARAELAGEALSEPQTQLVKSLVVDQGVCGPDFSGWYMDLIYDCEDNNAELFDPTIADVHTDPNSGGVLHAGVGHPNLMIISVKNECGVKAYVGPVLSYHEMIEGGLHRLTDEEWKARLEASEPALRPAWTEEFVR